MTPYAFLGLIIAAMLFLFLSNDLSDGVGSLAGKVFIEVIGQFRDQRSIKAKGY